MKIDLSLLQDRWSPGNSILLVDCMIKDCYLLYGLGWFKAFNRNKTIRVKDINGFELVVFLDEYLIDQESPIIRLQSQLEFKYL